MRTQTIRVRPDDAGARELPFAAVRDRIVAATAGGVSTIVLAGDPLRRGDLLPLVRVARAHGAADVVLVTDAAQVGSEDDARRLAAAGVTQVVITVGRADPQAHPPHRPHQRHRDSLSRLTPLRRDLVDGVRRRSRQDGS